MCTAAAALRLGPFSAQRQFILSSRLLSTTSSIRNPVKPNAVSLGPSNDAKPMSNAMKQYLLKKRTHDEFIAKERSEFELGKKHLGNMMGMNPDSMTQEDIDKAIDYLFPSGLFDDEARPKMKPPEEVILTTTKFGS